MKTFQDFSPYNGLQWEPDGSRSKRQLITVSDAASNVFKRHQTMNKDLIMRNDRLFQNLFQKFNISKDKR